MALLGTDAYVRKTGNPKPVKPINISSPFLGNTLPTSDYSVTRIVGLCNPKKKHYKQTTGHLQVLFKINDSSKVYVTDPLDGWEDDDFKVLYDFLNKKCSIDLSLSNDRSIYTLLQYEFQEYLSSLIYSAPTLNELHIDFETYSHWYCSGRFEARLMEKLQYQFHGSLTTFIKDKKYLAMTIREIVYKGNSRRTRFLLQLEGQRVFGWITLGKKLDNTNKNKRKSNDDESDEDLVINPEFKTPINSFKKFKHYYNHSLFEADIS